MNKVALMSSALALLLGVGQANASGIVTQPTGLGLNGAAYLFPTSDNTKALILLAPGPGAALEGQVFFNLDIFQPDSGIWPSCNVTPAQGPESWLRVGGQIERGVTIGVLSDVFGGVQASVHWTFTKVPQGDLWIDVECWNHM